jgi:hypothetical protein
MAASDPTIDTAAVWIDHDYDQRHAGPNSKSRYADLVRANAGWFDDAWSTDIPAAGAAATAWRIATTAKPGYVRFHRRIFDMLVYATDEGYLIAKIEIITPQSEALGSFIPDATFWQWHDWPESTWKHYPHETPTDYQVLRTPFLLCSAVLMFPVPVHIPKLGAEPLVGDALVEFATEFVSAITTAINDTVSPAIATLEV